MCLQYQSFGNTVGKGKIARNEQFLLIPVFSTHLKNFIPFSSNLKLSSANSFGLEESKICRLGKGSPFPKQQILHASKLKRLADDNFKFDENGRKLPKLEENTAGKGGIAH